MDNAELLSASGLIAVLLALAGFYGWRQFRTLKLLRTGGDLPYEEQAYVRQRARRRLACSVLMILAAGFLAGSFWFNATIRERTQKREVVQAENPDDAPEPEDKQLVRVYAIYWIAFLLILLGILLLAALDLLATRRFGLAQHRKIQAERRTMIEQEMSRLPSERNGFH